MSSCLTELHASMTWASRLPGICRVLIASIMEEVNKDAWEEIIGRCDSFVDCFEINFSCPHGMPERKMGMAMGQDPDLLHEVCHNTHRTFFAIKQAFGRSEWSISSNITQRFAEPELVTACIPIMNCVLVADHAQKYCNSE